MKRFLSLFLVLATLLCMIPLAVSAETVTPEAQAETTVTYLDLYVKDGLVALFDGHSLAASNTTPTNWAPVNLYGVEGYDDYINPTTYSYYFANGNGRYGWKQDNGGMRIYLKNSNISYWATGNYLNLDSLGALLGYESTITVQQLVTHDALIPVISEGVLTNYTSMYAGYKYFRGGDNAMGSFFFGGTQLTGAKLDGGYYSVAVVTENLFWADSNNYVSHLTYLDPTFGVTKYDTLTGNDGTNLNGYYVGGPTSIERTVTRHPYTSKEVDGVMKYTSTYDFYFPVAPTPRKNYSVTISGFSKTTDEEATHQSTRLRLAADGALTRSVRVYNKALDYSEIQQNHFADLVAYYGIDAATIETIMGLAAYQKSTLYSAVADIQIVPFKDLTAESDYMVAKAAFEAAIEEALTSIGAQDYISLYVKDGLVALFDAYGMKASNTTLTSWTPIALNGVAGYEDYLAPEAQTLWTQSTFKWQAGDGYLRLARNNNSGTYDAYMALSATLSAALAGEFTVQEVFKHDSLQNSAWELALDEDTKTATSITTGVNRIGQWQNGDYGYLKVGHTFYAINKSINNRFNYYQEAHYWGGTWKTSINFDSEYNWNGVTLGADYVSSNGTAIAGATVGNGKLGTAERSVMYSVSEANGTYTMTAKIYHHFAPATSGIKSFSLQMTTTDAATAYQANFTILRAATEKNYSVRLYNKVLNRSELDQNHMADLVAFYGIDASAVKALSPIAMKLFIDSVQGIRLAHNGKDLTPGSEYMTLKAEVEALLAASVNDFEAAYLDLYVKDGLVALFNGHEIKADDSASVPNLNKWMIDLSGVEGYDDYIDPTLYTVNAATGGNRVTYKQQDGGVGVVLAHKNEDIWNSNAAFDMSSLGALIGTTYSVQEIFSYNSMLPVVENGVITNHSQMHSISNYGDGWTFGSFKGGTTPNIGAGTDGVNNLYMTPVDQISFAGSYAGHWTYFGEGYSTVKYDSLKVLDASGNIVLNADGSEKVYENYYVGGAVSIERTFIRLGYTSAQVEKEGETVTQYTSTYKTFFNNKPWYRPGSSYWKAPNTTINFTSTDEAKHASTTLKVANMGLTRAIRVYNRELNKDEIYQNHLADICAVYEIDGATINSIKTFSEYTFKALCKAAYEIEITPTNDGWTDVQLELIELIAEYAAKEEAMMNAVVSFGGLSYRTSGDYGLRVMFSVDKDAIAYLESCGYTVEYGAIMAVKSNAGTEYNASASDLTVKVGEDGLIALATGNAATIVSTDAGLKHLTADNVSFAFTTIYKNDGSNADLYDATMLYRGFVVLTDAEGNSEIIYDELNVTSDPALNTPSLRALHNFVLENDPTLSEEMRKRLSFE